MNVKEQFRNLLIMAASDGNMNEAELNLLSDRAIEWGITDDEFEEAIRQAIGGRAVLKLPANAQERQDALKDMVRMMAADGIMNESEKQLFAVIAASLNMTGDEINSLIDEVIDES